MYLKSFEDLTFTDDLLYKPVSVDWLMGALVRTDTRTLKTLTRTSKKSSSSDCECGEDCGALDVRWTSA